MRKPYNVVPLIIEPHPPNYTGYKFITMIYYNDDSTINVIDNIIDKHIHSYVLDLCGPTDVDETKFIDLVINWYSSENYKKHPLSIEFSRASWSSEANKILRVFPIDYVTRIIGPINKFPMSGYTKCRKRKKRVV